MKNTVKTIFFGLILLLTAQSCSKEPAVTENTTTDSIAVTAPVPADSVAAISTLKLDKFGMPPQVEGCSCYFSDTKENFENERYIYVDDYGNSAYVQIAGKMIKSPMEEGDFDPSKFTKTIENGDFKVKMTAKKLSEQEEVMMFSGQMTVENKETGEKTLSPIYGECGC